MAVTTSMAGYQSGPSWGLAAQAANRPARPTMVPMMPSTTAKKTGRDCASFAVIHPPAMAATSRYDSASSQWAVVMAVLS